MSVVPRSRYYKSNLPLIKVADREAITLKGHGSVLQGAYQGVVNVGIRNQKRVNFDHASALLLRKVSIGNLITHQIPLLGCLYKLRI